MKSPTFEMRLESTGNTLRDRPSLVELVMAEVLDPARVRHTDAPAPTPRSSHDNPRRF